MPFRAWLFCALLGWSLAGCSQVNSASSVDLQASALLTKALSATTSGVPIADTSASGTATWVLGGSYASGTVSIKTKGVFESRMDLSIPDQVSVEVRNDLVGPAGMWVDAAGKSHRTVQHNCWGPAAWFSPSSVLLWALESDANVSFVGGEVKDGVSVDHLVVSRDVSLPDSAIAVRRLTTAHLYLDRLSHLLLAATYSNHPDNDLNTDIAVEVRFADYRSVNAGVVPFRIQRLLQGNLNLDLALSSASANLGLSDSAFLLQ